MDIIRIDGTVSTYSIRRIGVFGDLPGWLHGRIVEAIKAEIKRQYENGERFHIHCFPPHVLEKCIHGGVFHDITHIRLHHLGADIEDFCNRLFGPHVPYIFLEGGHIYFIKNSQDFVIAATQ
jgi:hypothetical protein